MELSLIRDTVQQVADAITAALGIETEIADAHLEIIGGTGRYYEKIGSFEEDGDLNGPYIYAKLLKTGAPYICLEPVGDPVYDAQEGELGEICFPIILDNQVIGLIGLIAFTEAQKEIITTKQKTLTNFLKIMSELIASRLLTEANNDSLKQLLSSALDSSFASSGFDLIIGESDIITQLKKRSLQVAPSDSTILITGESGTGKELFARAIHSASTRADKPFISINCGAIPEMLLESELFGYEKGAFTGADAKGKIGKFQLADGGTVFLDEVGDMPLHLQVKLLRVLQTRQIDKVGGIEPIAVDIRIVAATNKNLEALIAANEFREDLYFRLSVIPVNIPPLREHPEDIPAIINYAFKKFRNKLGKNIASISEDAYQLLCNYSWPGNVRELENAMEFAVNMENTTSIQQENLPDKIQYAFSTPAKTDYKKQSSDYQRQLIISCLETTGWDLEGKRKAAKLLGISESTLYRRLRD